MADLFPWTTCGRDAFDRAVELLVQRKHLTEGPGMAEAVDGRGGDGGVDIDVTLADDVLDTVYQLKYFPEGFSSGWSKTRRAQIKKSFEAAMWHAPRRWVLVIPGLPTVQERKWVRALAGSRKVEIATMGRDKLDELLARWPDIFHFLTFDPRLEALKVGGLAGQALATPDDLAAATTSLANRIDALSPYWSREVTIGAGGQVRHGLVAKRPDAAEKEPIHVVTEFHDSAEGRKASEALQRYLDAGGVGLTIPSDAVKSVRFDGPPWIAHNLGPGELVLGSHGVSSDRRIELRLVTSAGATIQSLYGSSRMIRGRREQHLEVDLDCGISAQFGLSDAPSRVDTSFEMRRDDDQPAEALADAIRFTDAFTPEADVGMRAFVEGKALLGFRNPSLTLTGWFDGYTRQLVDDLVVLGRHFGVRFNVPITLNRAQREEIRRCRLVVDGHVVEHGGFDNLTVTFSEKAGESILDAITPEAVMIVFETDAQYLVLGQALSVRVKFFHPQVRFDISPETEAALRAGTAAGSQAVATGVDSSPFRALLADDPRRKPDEPLVITELGIVSPDADGGAT